MFKNEFEGYNHFGARKYFLQIQALESPESQKAPKRPSDKLVLNIF